MVIINYGYNGGRDFPVVLKPGVTSCQVMKTDKKIKGKNIRILHTYVYYIDTHNLTLTVFSLNLFANQRGKNTFFTF